MSYMYVVTDVESGWDCVVGVYSTEELAEAACRPDPQELMEDPEFWMEHLDSNGMFNTRVIHCKKLDRDV